MDNKSTLVREDIYQPGQLIAYLAAWIEYKLYEF